jgi:hypothetical protein
MAHTPFEAFPFATAAPRHRGRCPLAVALCLRLAAPTCKHASLASPWKSPQPQGFAPSQSPLLPPVLPPSSARCSLGLGSIGCDVRCPDTGFPKKSRALDAWTWPEDLVRAPRVQPSVPAPAAARRLLQTLARLHRALFENTARFHLDPLSPTPEDDGSRLRAALGPKTAPEGSDSVLIAALRASPPKSPGRQRAHLHQVSNPLPAVTRAFERC